MALAHHLLSFMITGETISISKIIFQAENQHSRFFFGFFFWLLGRKLHQLRYVTSIK